MTEIVTEQSDGWETTVTNWVWEEIRLNVWAGRNHELFALVCWSNLYNCVNVDLRPLGVKVGGDRVTRSPPHCFSSTGDAMRWVEQHTKEELFHLTIAKPNSPYGGPEGW